MDVTTWHDAILGPDDLILVTGAAGFIGTRLVAHLLNSGCLNIRCFVRPSSAVANLDAVLRRDSGAAHVEIIRGNLLSREDCVAATSGAAVIFHTAAGRREKSIPDAFLNSVVTTRNLMESSAHRSLRRFVNVSSFAVYTNVHKPTGNLLDETCPVEQHPERRGDAYSFAKVKQEEIVAECGKRCGIPYVIVRPGYVYGPGNEGLTARVGISTFGFFLHLGGGNTIPLTYVDNCASAITLAGFKRGVDGEVFNIVDDDLPSSRWLLQQYKKNVSAFPSVYLPHALSYALCSCWGWYAEWSHYQLPPAFNRSDWYATWKKTKYSNEKVKSRLGWTPSVSTTEGLRRHFEACRAKRSI